MTKKHLKQLRSLSLLEWELLVAALILLPLTAAGLHFFGLKRTQRFLRNFTPLHTHTHLDERQKLQHGRIVAHMVSIAANHGFYSANCLKKSLVLWFLLRQKNIDSDLRIGVQKKNDVFDAHAWIEINGEILMDRIKIVKHYHPMT